jgi:hypothetical protein
MMIIPPLGRAGKATKEFKTTGDNRASLNMGIFLKTIAFVRDRQDKWYFAGLVRTKVG